MNKIRRLILQLKLGFAKQELDGIKKFKRVTNEHIKLKQMDVDICNIEINEYKKIIKRIEEEL